MGISTNCKEWGVGSGVTILNWASVTRIAQKSGNMESGGDSPQSQVCGFPSWLVPGWSPLLYLFFLCVLFNLAPQCRALQVTKSTQERQKSEGWDEQNLLGGQSRVGDDKHPWNWGDGGAVFLSLQEESYSVHESQVIRQPAQWSRRAFHSVADLRDEC